jgi:peptide/nickel transport system substrate-binding protein
VSRCPSWTGWANILITPAKDNRPEELRSGVGTGPYRVIGANSGAGE